MATSMRADSEMKGGHVMGAMFEYELVIAVLPGEALVLSVGLDVDGLKLASGQ